VAKIQRTAPVPVEHITQSILFLRGHRVILDRELAAIYGVETRTLNQAVKRNAERFPEDFMFQLTAEEVELSRSQTVILNPGRGQNIKYLPYAFTEHGAIQAANILSSPRAIEMGVYVVRAFVKLRELLSSKRELARRFAQLETRLDKKIHRARSRHRRHPLDDPRTDAPDAAQAPAYRIHRRSREEVLAPPGSGLQSLSDSGSGPCQPVVDRRRGCKTRFLAH
jgi:hypothetical protein